MKVKCAGSRKKAVWLTVLRSIKSCMPVPVGSGLSTRSLKWEKLVNPPAWSRERSLACSSPIRCGSRVIPIWVRRNTMIGAKSFSDQASESLGGGGEEPLDSSWDTSGSPPEARGPARLPRRRRWHLRRK